MICKDSSSSWDKHSDFGTTLQEEQLGDKLLERTQWVFVLSIVTVLISAPASISAQEIKIGVVNTEKILRESVPAIIAQKKIEKEFLVYDERIKKMASQISVLQEQLERNDKSIAEERRTKERELANISRQYQRAQQQMREDLSMRQNEEYSLILERVNKAIRNIAEKEDYDLILQLQDSVYRSQRIDITNQVIKALAEQESAAEK